MAVIEAVAAERGCELVVPDFARACPWSRSPERPCASSRGRGRGFETRLLGSYQPFNAALALDGGATCCAGAGGPFSEEAAVAGIASARWPGRFESGGCLPAHHRRRRPQPPGGRGPGRVAGRSSGGGGTRLRWTSPWACWPTRTIRPWCAPWRPGPAASRCTRRQALAPCRPTSWRPACARVLVEEGRADDVPVRVVRRGRRGPARRPRRCRAPRACAVAFGTLYAIADLMAAL